MATEVLRPQSFPIVLPRGRTSPPSSYGRIAAANAPRAAARRPATTSNQQKRQSTKGASSIGDLDRRTSSSSVRRVTVLKRGQSLDPPSPSGRKFNQNSSNIAGDLIVPRIESIALSPAQQQKVYAGFVFSESPSPSSLPLPTFSFSSVNNKNCEDSSSSTATKDLRRLLRIE